MKLFDKGAESLFKKNSSGKMAFYPYGMLSHGYTLNSDNDYQRILGKIKEYNKNIFFFLLIPLLGSAIAIQFVHSDNNLLIVSMLTAYTFYWGIQYFRIMKKETNQLTPIGTRSNNIVFIRKYVLFLMYFVAVFLVAMKLQDIVLGG